MLSTKLPKDFSKQLLQNLIALILILALYYITTAFTGCPIKYILGIACPGCGITRAWIAVLRLDFSAAFSYHPLFFIGPIAVLAILFHPWIDFQKWRWFIIVLLVLFVSTYFIRLFIFPDQIVNLNFTNGLIYKGWSIIFHSTV